MLIAFFECVTIVHLPQLTPLPKNEDVSLGNAPRTTSFCQSLSPPSFTHLTFHAQEMPCPNPISPLLYLMT